MATTDFISQIVQDRVNLITQFKKNKIKVFYKTEKNSQKTFSPHYDKLKNVGENYLDILSLNSRGIYGDLIKTYPIFIFDEIGTGALECFAKGVPVMIYWNKIWSRDALHAKNDFKALKQSKILFDDVNELIAELELFFVNPQFLDEHRE